MAEVKQFFMQLPPITRYWFGLSIAIPVIGRFGLFNPYHMILSSEFLYKLELWRPFTAVFYYPLTSGSGFHYLINLYFLYSYSKNLETGEFLGRPADYMFMLIFNWASLVLMGTFMNLFLLMDPLILSVIYVWCNRNPEVIVSFWFGTRFKAYYLPWVLLGFNFLLGGGGFYEVLGIVVGHLFYYNYFVNGLIATPSILYRYLPNYTQVRSTGSTLSSFPTASSFRTQRNQGSTTTQSSSGYNWGHGQVLGGR